MSSTGQIVGGIVGAVVGYFFGNPVLGAQIGMTIGGIVDPPKVQGPRLEDLVAQTSTYGVFIPRVHGTVSLTGNVFWIQGDKLIEREAEDSGKGGPEVTNYEYFATFAVGLCEGPIAGIRRIWVGGQLWYDAGVNASPNIIVSGLSSDTFTLYTGSETQLADPLIQADRGAANVPAYRGLAYIVFDALPLKGYGNSLSGAQVKVEVVSSGTLARPPVTKISTVDAGLPLYDPDTGRVARVNTGLMTFFDVNSGTEVYSFAPSNYTHDVSAQIVRGPRGTFFLVDENAYVQQYSFESMARIEVVTTNCGWRSYSAWSDYNNKLIMASSNLSNRITVWEKVTDVWAGTNYETVSSTYNTWGGIVVIPAFGPLAVNAGLRAGWVVLYNGDKICVLDHSYSVRLDYQLGAADVTADYGGGSKRLAYDHTRNLVYITNSIKSVLYVLDVALLTITRHAVYAGDNIIYHVQSDLLLGISSGSNPTFRVFNPDDLPNYTESFSINGPVPYIFGNLVEVEGLTDAVLTADWGSVAADGLFKIPFGKRISSSLVPLSSIVQAECLKSELLTAADLDVTELTDQVRGYRISNLSPIRGGIDPLRKAWPFDVVQAGYKIKFKKRGGASVATITDAELDARPAGTELSVRVSTTREMDTVMPSQLTVRYLDSAREYDVNVAEESR